MNIDIIEADRPNKNFFSIQRDCANYSIKINERHSALFVARFHQEKICLRSVETRLR